MSLRRDVPPLVAFLIVCIFLIGFGTLAFIVIDGGWTRILILPWEQPQLRRAITISAAPAFASPPQREVSRIQPPREALPDMFAHKTGEMPS